MNGCILTHLEGVALFLCYLPPSLSNSEYQVKLDQITEEITSRGLSKYVVAGDLNGRSDMWGDKTTNKRGKILLEWVTMMGLRIMNKGNTPTFVGGRGDSIPDVALASSSAVPCINWQRMDAYVSDHSAMLIKIKKCGTGRPDPDLRADLTPYRRVKLNKAQTAELQEIMRKCTSTLETSIASTDGNDIDALVKIITDYTRESISKVTAFKKIGKPRNASWKPKIWWSKSIADIRKQCGRLRRALSEARSRTPTVDLAEVDLIWRQYSAATDKLQAEIKIAKKEAWKRLLAELDNDVWGKGYKLAKRNFGLVMERVLTVEEQLEQVENLFPTRPETAWEGEMGVPSPASTPSPSPTAPPDFTEEELFEAFGSIRSGRAPGLDGIPPEVAKLMYKIHPTIFLNLFNRILHSGRFPNAWKKSRLVLLPKGDKPGKYRPLCMLDVFGKVYEKLLAKRIETVILPLSKDQYGFRKGKSTIQAIKRVFDAVRENLKTDRKKRKNMALIALDVRNAFNTVSWLEVIKCLRAKKIPEYYIRIIQDYFTERGISVSGIWKKMYCGVVQGSCLSPLLWNIVYDDVVDREPPPEVEKIAYADDLSQLGKSDTRIGLPWNLNRGSRDIAEDLRRKDLELAPEKTEAVILTSRTRVDENICFKVQDTLIQPQKATRLLGVWIDKNLSMSVHMEKISEKVKKASQYMMDLMPLKGGPRSSKRKYYFNAVLSIMLYAISVWGHVFEKKGFRDQATKLFRPLKLRVALAYRTVGNEALDVISGIPPIYLLVRERMGMQTGKDKSELKDTMLKDWQRDWASPSDSMKNKSKWTRRIFKDVIKWYGRRHGELNFAMTQLLSGHGSFGKYLCTIGKRQHESCCLCDAEVDNAEHAYFDCEFFKNRRERLELVLNSSFNPETLVDSLLESKQKWHIINQYVQEVFSKRFEKMKEDTAPNSHTADG